MGRISESGLSIVRQHLADLVRGQVRESPSVDLDPEYEEWIEQVAMARANLVARSEAATLDTASVIPLSSLSKPPATAAAYTSELSLAAEAGGPLFAELRKALAEPENVQYYEVPDVPGGRLRLAVDVNGLRATWEGPQDTIPQLSWMNEAGREQKLAWLSNAEQRLHQTDRHVPWVDGRVTVSLGASPRRTLAIEL